MRKYADGYIRRFAQDSQRFVIIPWRESANGDSYVTHVHHLHAMACRSSTLLTRKRVITAALTALPVRAHRSSPVIAAVCHLRGTVKLALLAAESVITAAVAVPLVAVAVPGALLLEARVNLVAEKAFPAAGAQTLVHRRLAL